MNLRALQYLVTLAELKHFSRAAEACFVSQPTLSTQIQKLEEELGVQLLERSPRKLMLTPIGEDIVARARNIITDIEAMKQQARMSLDPGSASLRLGIFPTLAPYLLPHVVPVIRQHYPQLSLQLFEEKTDDIIRLLGAGKLDAGLLALPVDDQRLNHIELFTEPFVLVAPSDHELAQRDSVTIADLQDHSLLLLEEGHCLRDQALEVCKLGGVTERLDFHATSMETLRQMVAAGTCITLMPNMAVMPPVPHYEDICIIPFADPVPSRSIALFWRKSSALADFMRELAPLFTQLDAQLLGNSAHTGGPAS